MALRWVHCIVISPVRVSPVHVEEVGSTHRVSEWGHNEQSLFLCSVKQRDCCTVWWQSGEWLSTSSRGYFGLHRPSPPSHSGLPPTFVKWPFNAAEFKLFSLSHIHLKRFLWMLKNHVTRSRNLLEPFSHIIHLIAIARNCTPFPFFSGRFCLFNLLQNNPWY